MMHKFLQDAFTEIRLGVSKKGHPFRYFTFGTAGAGGSPDLRTVVLRQVTEDFKLRIYTDGRSQKVSQLKKNNTVSLLFYHPKKLLQIKITGEVRQITDQDELKKYYSGVQPSSRKDYTTVQAPGSELSNPDEVAYLDTINYFTILEINPNHLEFLQLKRPNHIRIAFSKIEEDWKGQFINP